MRTPPVVTPPELHADVQAPPDAGGPAHVPDGVPGDELASRVREGSREAVAHLFELHGERMYNYCHRRSGSWSDAEDLTSEVFLTALKVAPRAPLDDEGLLPWLYSIATNVLRNHARSRRRGGAALLRMGRAPDTEDFSDDLVTAIDADQRLQAALGRLAQFPQTFQDAFLLNVWEGLSYEQVAQALDCPVGTVRSRIARVRTALRLTDEVSR